MNNRFTRKKCLLLTLASALLILCENGSTADDGLASRRSGIDCILLEKASIVDRYPHHEGYFGLANLGHQIGRGTHIVLAIRAYEESGNIDAQAFWKATLEFATIPQLRVQGMNQEVTVLKSYYSDGSSAWVPGGEYTWASNPFTRVQMSRTKNGIEVQLNASFTGTYAIEGRKRSVKIAWTCPVIQKAIEQLDPWEGKVGTIWESFTTPPYRGAER